MKKDKKKRAAQKAKRQAERNAERQEWFAMNMTPFEDRDRHDHERGREIDEQLEYERRVAGDICISGGW